MNRVHLFELEDQPWFPPVLRDAGTAYLEFAARVAGHSAALAPKLEQALARAGEKRIVDLCSGGAGPVAEVVDVLAARGTEVHALLTDFYPNEGSLARVSARSAGRIDWEREPVDATRVPKRLAGLRTLFNAFHHFRPAMARGIVADAAEAGRPIAIFEIVGRDPIPMLGIVFAPLSFALALPFLRPFRWLWIPFTYLVPILPLFVLWDGIVSCLRVYSPRELQALVDSLEPRHRAAYDWEIGRIRLPGPPVYATYLVGMPRSAQSPS
ncbi:MAG: class I SAM-dependent methyltransferase [Myxococcota bacterium]